MTIVDTHNYVRVRVEVVVVLGTGDLRYVYVHTAVVAPVIGPARKCQAISSISIECADLQGYYEANAVGLRSSDDIV